MVEELVEEGFGEIITAKTGLGPDAYFSATKITWILDHVSGARELPKQEICCLARWIPG